MDWNLNATSQWDWENLAMYTTKEIAVPKNLQFSSHETQENVGNFSYSASENSKETIGVFDDLAKELLEKEDQSCSWICENNGSFSNMAEEASVLSGEAMIGLKLGRHASSSSSNNNNKVPLFPPMIKRSRASYLSSQSQRCQVEGCNLDLSSAKDYHRRHRICANHSKSPKVVVSGMERRFCQQCSRFHDLSEFDDRKRSCRRRLSAHNARRRRPHSEEIQFTSTRLSSSISDRRPQMNFLLNRASLPILDSTPAESSCNFKGGGNDLLRTSGLHFDSERFMPRNMNHNGIEATPNSILSGNVRHAFSLLSTSSWPSNWPEESSSFDQFSQANLSQPGMPLALQNTSGTNQLQNFHSFRSPQEYERFYSN